MDLTDAADRRITVSPLPDLHQEDPLMPTRPIAAAGQLWAPYFTERCPSRLVMRRLDKESGRWVQAGAAFHPPQQETSDCALHGYAVVRETVILLSLQPPHLFVAFDCSTCAWNVVATDDTELYVTIDERGVYVEQDDTIYALCGSTVYAYKLCHDQEQNQYRMGPPIFVEQVSPFQGKGSGVLTHLGGRVMCLVCVPFHHCDLRCNCDTLHVLITTFRVKSGNGGSRELFVPKGVRILHSTCRRVDVVPSESSGVDDWTFRFLQEYEELGNESASSHCAKKESEQAMPSSMPLEGMEVLASSNVEESSKLLTCCRIIAISDTLQVFLFVSDTHEWERIHAFESAVLEMKIWEENNMCLLYQDFGLKIKYVLAMCLDYIGKDINSGTIMLCVLQGNKCYACPGVVSKDPVSITTIQVKTEKMPDGKWKPLVIGHVDAGTFFVEPDGGHQIWTRSCFAVGS
ncbi:hypothetical protein EJB05_45238, partial [Eragrostis curvula]